MRINEERINTIDHAVEELRLTTGLSYPENNLIQITDALGISVSEVNLPDFDGKKVKGYIRWFTAEEKEIRKISCDAEIFVNSQQTPTVKNFTLAHELGHFLLHKNSNSFRIDFQDYSAEGDPLNQETEANYFAGSLLMPKEKLLKSFEKANSLDEVAEMFGVSRPAVEARVKWLGYKIS